MSIDNDVVATPMHSPSPRNGEYETLDADAAFYDVNDEKRLNDEDGRIYSHRPFESSSYVSTSNHLSHTSSPKSASLHSSVADVQATSGYHIPEHVFEDEEVLAAEGDVVSDHQQARDPHFARQVSEELLAIYRSFQKCLTLRDKYMHDSCQNLSQNPNSYDHIAAEEHPIPGQKVWNVYPPAPLPFWKPPSRWDQARERQSSVPDPEPFDFAKCAIPGPSNHSFALTESGIFEVYASLADEREQKPCYKIPSIRDYYMDLDYILSVITDGPAKSFAYRRLKYLSTKWNMYSLLNEVSEMADMKRVPHRDFYNVRKVDTHVHHSSCMNQKHLLRFIKYKLRSTPDDVVIFRDGQHLTLKQVFESLNLTSYDLSIDMLDMHAHQDAFHRFDKFNLKYSPIGESRLREVFLKTDNLIKGKYLAELTQEVMSDLESSKYQHSEWRISVYGRSMTEWDKLAKWVVNNHLFSHNVRWVVQIPRLYELYHKDGTVSNFADLLNNVFLPLFEVSQDSSKHPELHVFLQRVVALDSVDDESKVERRIYRKYPIPSEWNNSQNPPYSYWLYYMYANLTSLNQLRKERGFNTLALRPHAGEAGDVEHLSSAFLTSQSISHGILLRKVPALQYLYYLKQIGLAMSPLSNNSLFLTYERNPFPDFFKIGLNVSLSTDDPLQFHFTREPLVEEYSVAAQIYKLSPADMCELARNSVLQSGFEMSIKRHWIGRDFDRPGMAGNDMKKTNVPNSRLEYRRETLQEELALICSGGESTPLNRTAIPLDLNLISSSLRNGDAKKSAPGAQIIPGLASMSLQRRSQSITSSKVASPTFRTTFTD